MKFSKNNTCLHFLEAKKAEEVDFVLPERDQEFSLYYRLCFKQSIQESFITHGKEMFGGKIQYVSDTFLDAFEKAKPKLVPFFDREPITQNGVLVFKGNKSTHTMFYVVKTVGTGKDFKWQICILFFVTLNEKPVQHQLHVLYLENYETDVVKSFNSKLAAEMGGVGSYWASFLIGFLTFCKYCEIETKVVQPNRKEHHVGTQYKNETVKPIEVLDATWFTTIVRSDGFTVGAETGGFFRWQPCGPGQTSRKLMWIMPFEKQGYIRKAKKLLKDENTNI